MPRQLRDQRNRAFHALHDDLVHRLQVVGDQGLKFVQVGFLLAFAIEIDHQGHGVSPFVSIASRLTLVPGAVSIGTAVPDGQP